VHGCYRPGLESRHCRRSDRHPGRTIGERLYQAKIYLDTGDLFAWTIVVVGLSILVDKAIVHGLDRMFAFVENR